MRLVVEIVVVTRARIVVLRPLGGGMRFFGTLFGLHRAKRRPRLLCPICRLQFSYGVQFNERLGQFDRHALLLLSPGLLCLGRFLVVRRYIPLRITRGVVVIVVGRRPGVPDYYKRGRTVVQRGAVEFGLGV